MNKLQLFALMTIVLINLRTFGMEQHQAVPIQQNNVAIPPLIKAVHKRNYSEVQRLATIDKTQINTRDELGQTALHWAAMFGYNHTVVLLIRLGADINAQDFHRITPLHNAAQNGHTDLIKLLVTLGADINACDEYGDTPLSIAIRNQKQNFINTVVLLLSLGASALIERPISNDRHYNDSDDELDDEILMVWDAYDSAANHPDATRLKEILTEAIEQQQEFITTARQHIIDDMTSIGSKSGANFFKLLEQALNAQNIAQKNGWSFFTHANIIDGDKRTFLHHTALAKNLYIFDTLCMMGCYNPCAKDVFGKTCYEYLNEHYKDPGVKLYMSKIHEQFQQHTSLPKELQNIIVAGYIFNGKKAKDGQVSHQICPRGSIERTRAAYIESLKNITPQNASTEDSAETITKQPPRKKQKTSHNNSINPDSTNTQ